MQKRKTHNTGFGGKMGLFVVLFIILFGFWLLLSGHFTAKFITYGVIAGVVGAALGVKLCSIPIKVGEKEVHVGFGGLNIIHAVTYFLWLVWQIILANIQVAKTVLKPKIDVDPTVIKFYIPFRNPLASVVLANSITLTPGTITMDIQDNVFYVHALTKSTALDLFDPQHPEKATMVYKVAKLFNDGEALKALKGVA